MIVNNIPENQIAIDTDYYSLSEKGRSFLDSNKNLIELHRHKDYDITLEDYYYATKNDTYKRSFNDIVWQIFNQRTLEYVKNSEYIKLRFNYFYMANLLMRENKKEQALQLYLYCLVIDVSGIESINAIESYKSGWCTKKEFLERLENHNLIPSLINQIIELNDYYNKNMLIEAYNDIYLPFNVSSLEYLNSLVNDAFNSAVFDFDKYTGILIKNKKKFYLKMV